VGGSPWMVESWVPSDAAGFPESFPPSVWLLPHSSADANSKLGGSVSGSAAREDDATAVVRAKTETSPAAGE
jgi:hypothetical protein